VQIRRDLYAATDLANKATIVTKFEIGSNVSPASYIAYHAALEYHGLATQIFNRIYVADIKRFTDFEFEGISYIFCQSNTDEGIVHPPFNSLLKVTDVERTIIDCLDNIGLAGGLEELVLALSLVGLVKENLLLNYMEAYNKQVLYQKAGFILSYFREKFRLSDNFFAECRSKISKSVRYLTDDGNSTVFFKEWKLYAPENILSFLEQGGGDYV
jgi:predicted transcriptional regulator of viral defense system